MEEKCCSSQNKNHLLSFIAPSYLLISIVYSPQQALKVFFGLDGLSLTWESDCRLSLTFFFTSLWKKKKKHKLSVVMICEGKILEAQTLWPPTSPDEAQPRRHWFPLWHSFRRTRPRMPARKGLTYLTALSLFRHLGGPGVCIHIFTSLGRKNYTPWPTSLRANCSHSFPLGAALWGRPCFQ